jgi:hypothetical protein
MTIMRASLAALAFVLLPSIAAAQPSAGGGGYYGQPPPGIPGGFHDRAGSPMFGFSLGLGGMQMDDAEVTCPSCSYQPIGVEVDAHIGGMLSHQFGLMLELQFNAETVESRRYDTTTLVQSTAMIAGQYFLTPRLWIKGGIGLAHLSYEYDDDYYYESGSEPIDNGAVLMAAIGYELLSTRTFAIDVQGRLISAGYDGIDQKVTAATVGIGFNWYGIGTGGGILIIH